MNITCIVGRREGIEERELLKSKQNSKQFQYKVVPTKKFNKS
jgi:hypothetical protein